MNTSQPFYPVMEIHKKRISAARQRLALTWQGNNDDRPAFIFSDVNYALCGQRDAPEDYYLPAAMFRYQRDKIDAHLNTVPDDYLPVFYPWYGTTVLPSALGVKVRWEKGTDPAAEGPAFSEAEDAARLALPDFDKDGDLPQVLDCLRYFRSHTDAPVCVTDIQGPLSTAIALAGADNLFVWMYTDPEVVHQLMDFCTEALIGWVAHQKKLLGQPLDCGAYPHAIELPPGHGGVAFSDDDIVAISTAHFIEFVRPYNERLLAAFGGGTIHFCGSARHQLEAMAATKHCTGINNFSMADFEQLAALRQMMPPQMGLMACDFNMEDAAAHAAALKACFPNPRGVVAAIYLAPDMMLRQGRYSPSQRTAQGVREDYLNAMSDWLNK